MQNETLVDVDTLRTQVRDGAIGESQARSLDVHGYAFLAHRI